MLEQTKEIYQFIELCFQSKDVSMVALLLDLFLTPEELTNLVMRISIICELIKKEKTQRDIAKGLNVSIAKISRGSNELKKIDKRLLAYLKENLTCS